MWRKSRLNYAPTSKNFPPIRSSAFQVAFVLLGVVILVVLLAPIIYTLGESSGGLASALTDPLIVGSILTSFYAAFLATVIVFVTGVPLAYVLSRYQFPGKSLIDAALDLPILIPHDAAGVALLLLLSPKAPLGRVLMQAGLCFTETLWGIVIAMAFVSAPFMIRAAQEAFESVDVELEMVARSLGASPARVFWHVTLPLSARGILRGCLLTWGRAISEFGAVVILAYYPMSAPVALYYLFITRGLSAAIPMTGLLVLMALAILVGVRLIAER